MTSKISIACVSFAFIFSIQTVAQTPVKEYPDTMWIPVIFYDYWVDNKKTNPDFEIAESSNTKGMVRDTLDAQRKPIPTPLACPTPNPNPPMACNLSEWFRVSGKDTSDFTCAFQCSTSSTNPNIQYWHWTNLQSYLGRPGEFIGPNYNLAYNMRNVVIYDSLPFLHLGINDTSLKGMYEYNNPWFFPLDKRGFGIQPDGAGHNFGFAMELHMLFQHRQNITFNFTGDDDVWAFVNNKLVMDLGGKHVAANGSFALNNAGLKIDSTYKFDFFFAERHTTNSTIKITTNIMSPRPNELKVIAPDTIVAGDTATIIGQILDQNKKFMPGPSDSITWSFLDSLEGDKLIGSPDDTVKFTSTKAPHGIVIQAKYTNGKITLMDTVKIHVKAGPPAQVDIVIQNRTQLDAPQVVNTVKTSFPWTVVPRLTVTLVSSLTRMYVYAVLRDRLGNFTDSLANSASWVSLHPDTATVIGTPNKLFEGDINRAQNARTGITYVIASSAGLKPDTAKVVLHPDSLIAIMLVDSLHPNDPLDTINMNTDQSMTILVKGKWSTAPNDWVDITGLWSTLPPNSLPSTIPLPTTETGNWPFSPTEPDTAKLVVESMGISVTVPVFIWEKPDTLALVLLTHPDSCYAGKPLQLAAYLKNSDGFLKNPFTGKSTYHDTLDNSLRPKFLPWMSVNPPAIDSLDKEFSQTWEKGADTFQLTLYYAPLAKDSLHRMQLSLNTGFGMLVAKTIPFRLRPGPIDSLQIEDDNHVHQYQQITLVSPNGTVHLNAVGFDKYGNSINPSIPEGAILNNVEWKADSPLPPPTNPIGQNIFYSAQNALYDIEGLLWATLKVDSTIVKDNVPIKIIAAGAKLDSAITHDWNGNGLIDCINLVFNKKIDIDLTSTGAFNVNHSGHTFTVDSIGKLSDSTYVLFVHEIQTDTANPIPQSSWKPFIGISNLPKVQSVTGLIATDGCPPVIWEVVKHISSPDRRDDTVRVCFSEKITNPDGGKFGTSRDQPVLTFHAWTKNGAAFNLVTTMFDGIKTFANKSEGDSVYFFPMSNGNDLSENHYLNIIAANRPLRDKSGNFPVEENQKVRVKVTGGKISLTIYPNPSKVTFTHTTSVQLMHNPNAKSWVENSNSGFVISIGSVPVNLKGKIRAYLKIHDVVGNIVFSASCEDLLSGKKTSDYPGSVTDIDFFWPGANSRGMAAAPGAYRVVLYVIFPPGSGINDTRLIKKAGVHG